MSLVRLSCRDFFLHVETLFDDAQAPWAAHPVTSMEDRWSGS